MSEDPCSLSFFLWPGLTGPPSSNFPTSMAWSKLLRLGPAARGRTIVDDRNPSSPKMYYTTRIPEVLAYLDI